jgi:hypothetical protein
MNHQKLNHYRLEAGRLKSWLEAGKHSKECSSLQRDVAFVTRFGRIDMATDGGIDHLIGYYDGEKQCDCLCIFGHGGLLFKPACGFNDMTES